ncbi:Galactosyl transferase [Ostreococcus tauri]|uniref:Galactosyl transferase n=1 Tax=Ostreococcus tauri TaxID=70448 RepID=A0A096PAF0_OSTTA|nr:Galactosyl transferase [Ostreococcus tauri]CEG01893.1 Galactosyl transferase [Ostreococcus tauri]|eukprot:XP_003084266.2 Galactosyl transferase [Ostreococcus tauri]
MANKQAYADAHGYDFIVHADVIDGSTPTRSWSKLLAMRKHLPRYDFLLYVDVDAVVMNPETGLEDIVDFDYDQVLAADANGVHCGVRLVRRNTPWTLRFLDELWARERVFEDERRALHHLYASTRWRDAGARGYVYPNANTVRARTKIVHACAFDAQPWFYEAGDFIIRLAELQGTVKCVVFARYYARARASMRAKGMFIAADVDLPPPSAWTCLTKNA